MIFQLYKNKKVADFLVEQTAFSGVLKITEKVENDIRLVTDAKPGICGKAYAASDLIMVGTVGKSEFLEELSLAGKIDLEQIKGKREVYSFQLIEHPTESVERALVIAGSDKRGTIYGLFHISELLGVSPFVDWCDAKPEKRAEVLFDESVNMVSKEPSVKYRGFFINDEWPAFGNWCTKNFGGFNAKAYEHVFELLLRLKGNYLWPAMWSARFEDEGPGLENARLADELGVVMGMSHHEPCLRQGEEYRYLRGKDSVYGDAWNFRTNKEGITKFWEDGLKRSGKFENVITVGMRGEADTAILGKNAGLADNIELLRDVLKTQRKLIQEHVNGDLSQVPRMLALYKEVEEFFYGNKDTKGLMGCEELEDVILMLCDDNFGNLRTLPTEEMRKHKGGYGMYYHFDYHGWPISYEWINSSYLPKIWEQMTMAYDFGVRDLWIVNVGDICTQEFPLAYFLDLAYDFETWGTSAVNKTEAYTKQWVKRQFGGMFEEADLEKVVTILDGYTKIAQRRRPEAMNPEIYHPVFEKETELAIREVERLLELLEELYEKLKQQCDKNQQTDALTAFFALLYYPASGTLNLYKMQMYAGWNHYFAKLGAMIANEYGKVVKDCLKRDRELVETYHTIANGKFYGMGMSEHIGFVHWNEDECQNPIIMQVLPADKPRVMVMVDGTSQHAEGSPWLPNKLILKDFLAPDCKEASISLYNISEMDTEVSLDVKCDWITCSLSEGEKHWCTSLNSTLGHENMAVQRVVLRIDRSKVTESGEGEIIVKTPAGACIIVIPVCVEETAAEDKTFFMQKGYASIEAEHFIDKKAGANGEEFVCLKGYGKTKSAMKVFPTTAYFKDAKQAPQLTYQFVTKQAGDYEVELYMQPSNPVTTENELCFGICENESKIKIINVIDAKQKIGDNQPVWAEGVLNNIRKKQVKIFCREGVNQIHVFAVTPGFVLEKLVIYPVNGKPENCYLGPAETYFKNQQ